ncbi:hypothetical protein D3C76_77920 [compost metagenome]
MTHKAVLLITSLIQNRDLLECASVAKFKMDEEGIIQWIILPGHKIRIFEKPDQKHGVVYKYEFHQGKKPYFTVQDYLRGRGEEVVYLKKTPTLQEPLMEKMLGSIQSILQETTTSMNHIGRWLAGAA